LKVIFLGTNGWYDTKTGNTVCTLVETEKYYLILDAGNGINKVDQYISERKPVYLFITHFHFDHIIGLHIMNKFDFKHLNIYGQKGTRLFFNKIINIPFTVPFSMLPYKVEINELSEGRHNIPFPVECRFLNHSSKCLGYRFEIDNKIVAYCTDTGVCDNAIELGRNADLLITECSFKSGQRNTEWPHLNPEDAAMMAKEADVKKLALLHFDANIYKTIKERKNAEDKAREIFNNTFAAMDNMKIEL
jgi:ribonuclease BN (tRNA processing enzyme)